MHVFPGGNKNPQPFIVEKTIIKETLTQSISEVQLFLDLYNEDSKDRSDFAGRKKNNFQNSIKLRLSETRSEAECFYMLCLTLKDRKFKL